MSSLIPGADDGLERRAPALETVGAGRPPVRVRVHEQLGAGTERRVGDGVEVADDHVRLHAHLEERVGAAVDGEEHRLEVADVGPHDPEVALVARPARHDDRVPVAEPRLQRRELDPVREQLPLVAQVAERVVGERLERLGDPALLVGERDGERRLGELDPFREPGPVAPQLAAAHGQRLALGDLLEQVGPRGVDEADAARGRARAGPGFGKRPELDGETLTTARTPESASSSAETRSRSTWSMIARSPGRSRLTRSFVRRPSRAVPTTSVTAATRRWRWR